MPKNQLLAETNPKNLRHVAVGSFLSFFVFFGAFVTTDSALLVVYGTESGFVACTGCPVVSAQPTSGPGYGTAWKGTQPNPGPPAAGATQYGRDGYMMADINKDGRLSKTEIASWNQNWKQRNSNSGTQSAPSGSGSVPPTKSINSNDPTCLSLGGCDRNFTDI